MASLVDDVTHTRMHCPAVARRLSKKLLFNPPFSRFIFSSALVRFSTGVNKRLKENEVEVVHFYDMTETTQSSTSISDF